RDPVAAGKGSRARLHRDAGLPAQRADAPSRSHQFALAAPGQDGQCGLARLMRISLAQVGKFIVDLGEVPAAALKDVPAEFAADEVERWSTLSKTPKGELRHLRPAVQLSETPPYWGRPPVPPGCQPAAWA